MARGKVKWFSQAIGGGFIRTNEGQDVFFRIGCVQEGDTKIMQRGQDVSFDILKKRGGLSLTAANVKATEFQM